MSLSRYDCERIVELVATTPSRDRAETVRLIEQCKTTASELSVARVVWDHVANVLSFANVSFELPPPASDQVLCSLDHEMRDRFGYGSPTLLEALLRLHNGLAADCPSALYSAETTIEWMDVLSETDKTVLTISGSLSGNSAVLRTDQMARDYGQIYAYWHEDYAERGFEFMARNVAEYLLLATESIVETVSGMYRGPTEIPSYPAGPKRVP